MKKTFAVLRDALARAVQPANRRAVPVTEFISITMVRNEQDLIEPFLRHHHRLFDAMLVLDNNSSDRTREIANLCAAGFGNVVVIDAPDWGYDQEKILSAALNHAQGAYFADFVLPLDVDEFLPVQDRAELRRKLADVPVGACAQLAWRTYMPGPEFDGSSQDDPLKHVNWVRVQERPAFYKMFLRLGGGLHPGMRIMQGAHLIRDHRGVKLRMHPVPDLPLLHVPLRSRFQLATKSIGGWLGYLARNQELPPRQGFQKKRLYEAMTSGGLTLENITLHAEAMAYAQSEPYATWQDNARAEPFPIRPERRHSNGSFQHPDALIDHLRNQAPMPGQDFVLPAVNADRHADGQDSGAAWPWPFPNLDAAPFRLLIARFAPGSVADIGCGKGTYLTMMKAAGVAQVFGVDQVPLHASLLARDEHAEADLQQPFDAGRRFDLVMCLEVLEHLRPEATVTLLDTIENHAKDRILFSVAEPGQPGHLHINCLPMHRVLALWQARGWYPVLGDTLALRAIATFSWFRRNLLLLERGDPAAPSAAQTEATRQLLVIAGFPYRWYDQQPGVRLSAFADPYPPAPKGYGRRL